MRCCLRASLALAAVLGIAACAGPSQVTKLTAVPALPKPALPSWILSVSPVGNAQALAQIRVIFARPVVKLEALSGDGPRDVLDRFSIQPELKGHFVLLTPRMIGFVAEQALPIGTRARVTLQAGLSDLAGDVLRNDLAWTFETAPLTVRGLPRLTGSEDEPTPAPVGLRPKIAMVLNASTDATSLAEHTSFAVGSRRVAVTVTPQQTASPYPGGGAAEAFDPSRNDWRYDVVPQSDLQTATTYTVTVDPGVVPAYGNVPTQTAFRGQIRTYGPLTIVATPTPNSDSGGRFAGGDPAIAFSNPLDPASVSGALSVSPAPANVKALTQLSDDASALAIDPYALEPNAHYTVTVAAGVKDIFGQTLGRTQNVTLTTGNFAAGAWAPSGSNVIPAGLNVALNLYATNLPGNRYQAAYARLSPRQLLGYVDPRNVLPQSSTWPMHTLAARPNVQSVVRVPLQQRIGGSFGALAYGFRTALDAAGTSPSLVGTAQLTNLGVFSLFFPQRGIVLVQHLNDGSPAGGATVTVYRNVESSGKPAPIACANAATDAHGEARFGGVDVERCYAGSTADQPPVLGLIAAAGSDAASLTLDGMSGLYRFGVNAGWSSGAPLSRGTIFSDRQMYQPGETGRLTGIAYYVSGTHVVADRNAVYRVTLIDPSNAETALATVRTDPYGIFSLPIAFAKHQSLGYYTITAKGSSGNSIDGSLRVAEFKPPNFALDLQLDAPWAPAGGSVGATAAASYLFGAPLQGGTAHAYVTRDAATVQPKGWDEFSFGRQWFWPEQTPSFDIDVLSRDIPFDDRGKLSLDVSVPRDLPFPMTYTVDVAATDVSNLSVSASQSFLALPSDSTIGVASDTVATAGKGMPVRVIVTNAQGQAVAGRAVHIELQKMTYTSATQEVEGGQSAQQAVKYDTVSSAAATSAERPVVVNVTPDAPGAYRVRATFAGMKTDAAATDIQVFAFGSGQADWGASDPSVTSVELDKKSYAVGDTATALVGSPFERSDVYVSVIRGDALYRTTLRDVAGAARVSFTITPEMLPNAAVAAVVVRRGANLASASPGAPTTLARTGVAPLRVDLGQRYLKLVIAPARAKAAPGAAQSVAFTLRDKNGRPASGEIVAMVVNDAILQLSGYRLPDLVTTVFAEQPISALIGDSRDGILLKSPAAPLEKGFGYGGGYLAGAAGTRVRRQFLPLAYYATVRTDAAGAARMQFKLPDDLTTWRVMAVAVGTDDTRFATADATFVSSLPLMTNPLLPQFARPGDTFDLGVSVSNQTGAAGALELVLELSGALAFADGNASAQTSHPQAAVGMQAFRFPVRVGTPAPSSVGVKGALGSARDGFDVPFEIRDRATTESVIESGSVTNASVNVPIDVSPGGRVQLALANSVVSQFAVPSEQIMGDDALPLASQSASRLTIAAALRPLQQPYRLKLDFDPALQAQRSLTDLLGFQREDGGFGETRGARESDPFVSAYALNALAAARQNGVQPDPAALTRARSFASATLANPGRFRWCSDPSCKARLRFALLWSLAQAGDRRTDFLPDIVAASSDFDEATQLRLARYLRATPGWQERGGAMSDRLVQTLYVTGRYATANTRQAGGWMGGPVRAQAEMLQLLIDRHAPSEQRDGAVRALIAQQCNCGWATAGDTAAALEALRAYARVERVGPATVEVEAGGRIAAAQLGPTAAFHSAEVAAASLHGNAITIRARGATVHYTLLYTYPIKSGEPGRLAAFRVVRTVTAPGSPAPPLTTMDLAPAAPLQVQAGRVFDVGVRVIVDHPVDRLTIDDPLPGGFEAVDTTFATTLKAVIPASDSWEIDAQQIYRDRVVAYAGHLEPGVYDVHYLVRSVTPGTFAWPGASAYLVDAPEQFGRSAATTLRVVQ